MLHTFHGHPLKHLSFCVPTNFPVKELSTCSQPERAKQFLAETNQYKTTLQSLWHMEFCEPTSKRNKDNISHRASRYSNSSAKHRLTSQTTWWHLSHFYAWRVSHKHHEASQLASCLRTVYRSPHATEEILSLACIFQEGGGESGLLIYRTTLSHSLLQTTWQIQWGLSGPWIQKHQWLLWFSRSQTTSVDSFYKRHRRRRFQHGLLNNSIHTHHYPVWPAKHLISVINFVRLWLTQGWTEGKMKVVGSSLLWWGNTD